MPGPNVSNPAAGGPNVTTVGTNTAQLANPANAAVAINGTPVTYSTDSSGNVTGLVAQNGQLVGAGGGYKTQIRRQRAANYLQGGALIQVPAWQATHAYPFSAYQLGTASARLPAGQLIAVQVAGTSGGSAPTYSSTIPITDSSVTWYATGKM